MLIFFNNYFFILTSLYFRFFLHFCFIFSSKYFIFSYLRRFFVFLNTIRVFLVFLILFLFHGSCAFCHLTIIFRRLLTGFKTILILDIIFNLWLISFQFFLKLSLAVFLKSEFLKSLSILNLIISVLICFLRYFIILIFLVRSLFRSLLVTTFAPGSVVELTLKVIVFVQFWHLK